MSTLQENFATAQTAVTQLPERPDNATLLKLYALYKQAQNGDASGAEPGWTDFVGRAKWDAWLKLKGKSPDQAMQEYIDLVAVLQAMYED